MSPVQYILAIVDMFLLAVIAWMLIDRFVREVKK